MSKFFCDTNCELWYDICDSLKINVIKMPYTINGQQYYYDLGRETDNRKFFEQMRNNAKAKTQALNKYDYIEYFEPVMKEGEDILYISFSHKMSGTFDAMNAAITELKTKYPERKITVVNTKSISMGAGTLVYYAAVKHNEGASDEQVVEFVNNMRLKSKTYFTVKDLVYLMRGGRLSGFKAVMGTVLNLKPIIEMNDEGALINTEKVKGRKTALNRLVSFLERDNVDTSYPIMLMNADCDEDAEFTKDLIKAKYPEANVKVQLVGPVIGSHCGPDTIGLIFLSK